MAKKRYAPKKEYKPSPKVQAAMQKVLKQFETGDLSPLIQAVSFSVDKSWTSATWSSRNKMLAFLTTGAETMYIATYNQLKNKGHQVQKSQVAGYIYQPCSKKVKKEVDGQEKEVWVSSGFYKHKAVFGLHNTDCKELPNHDPAKFSSLDRIAKNMNVGVSYQPLPSRFLGLYFKSGDKISVGTENKLVLAHEIAHAAHERVLNKEGLTLSELEKTQKEIVAETAAVIMMKLFENEDYTGNCWNYIKHYAPKDPMKAVEGVLGDISKVLDLVFKYSKLEQAEPAKALPA
ncbi:MAG: hypothetical protein GY928_36145 [Colwellia sp.]|nr:hypothetical protein [Colwellia sp.]